MTSHFLNDNGVGGRLAEGAFPPGLTLPLHSFKEKGSTWCPALCCSFQEGQDFLQDARQSWAGQGMNSGWKFPCLTPWHHPCSPLTLNFGVANLAVPSAWSALPLITDMADPPLWPEPSPKTFLNAPHSESCTTPCSLPAPRPNEFISETC